MELKLSQSCSLPTAIFSSSAKHFTLLAQRSKGQYISKKLLVHVVKEDETLSSISKLYRVSVLEFAAANKGKISNADLVFKGQHLNIHSAIAQFSQVTMVSDDLQRFIIPSDTTPKTTTGLLLVLVPLIFICIRCVMGAFRNIVDRKLRNRAANKSGVKSNNNSMRWKNVLSDEESEHIPDQTSDEHEQFHSEVILDAYLKLEDEYQQFLSECGVSNAGYWRRGSPK
ncbi:hypothetical protein CASFOL_016440 [Castilleja foliolosa]|uniref:LysM domain-containing protein n=1 Tax=Castilleja foliolosa TaxID=1961234 RepID=A0ABD3DHD4_9LAMI